MKSKIYKMKDEMLSEYKKGNISTVDLIFELSPGNPTQPSQIGRTIYFLKQMDDLLGPKPPQ
jgi:hypothetical protein